MAEHYCVVGQICPPGLLKESMQFYQGRLNIVAFQKKNHVKNLFELYCIVGQNCVPGTYQAQQGRLKLAAARKCRADLLAAIFDPNLHNAAQFCLAFGRGLFCPLLSLKHFRQFLAPGFSFFHPWQPPLVTCGRGYAILPPPVQLSHLAACTYTIKYEHDCIKYLTKHRMWNSCCLWEKPTTDFSVSNSPRSVPIGPGLPPGLLRSPISQDAFLQLPSQTIGGRRGLSWKKACIFMLTDISELTSSSADPFAKLGGIRSKKR